MHVLRRVYHSASFPSSRRSHSDAALAKRLADGFEILWAKAMRKLREIAFQPGQ
jgi:hypothetical protein